MPERISATTEGEKIIQLDSKIDRIDIKVDYVVTSLERVISAFEKLEDTKVTDHELRLSKLEKWVAQWQGIHKLLIILSLLGSIIAVIISMKFQ